MSATVSVHIVGLSLQALLLITKQTKNGL